MEERFHLNGGTVPERYRKTRTDQNYPHKVSYVPRFSRWLTIFYSTWDWKQRGKGENRNEVTDLLFIGYQPPHSAAFQLRWILNVIFFLQLHTEKLLSEKEITEFNNISCDTVICFVPARLPHIRLGLLTINKNAATFILALQIFLKIQQQRFHGLFFPHLRNIHWICKVISKENTSVDKKGDRRQPDVPVWLQELIPVKNALPHTSFGWERSELCEGCRPWAGGRAGSHQLFWCRLMHDSNPCAKYQVVFLSCLSLKSS